MRVFGLPGTYAVRSESVATMVYLVRLSPFPACTCPGFRYRGQCKHLRLVQAFLLPGGQDVAQTG